MHTPAQYREEQKAKLEKARKEAEARAKIEDKILDAWPENVPFHMLHARSGYPGCVAMVSLARDYYGSFTQEDERMSLDVLKQRLKELPPLPMHLRKGSFTHITLEDAETPYWAKDSDIVRSLFGVSFRIQKDGTKAEWFTKLDCGVIHLAAPMKNPPYSMSVDYARNACGDIVGVRHKSLITAKDTPSPGGRLSYSSGSSKEPGDMVAYWQREQQENIAKFLGLA